MSAIAPQDPCRFLSSGSKSLARVVSGWSDPLNGFHCTSKDGMNYMVRTKYF